VGRGRTMAAKPVKVSPFGSDTQTAQAAPPTAGPSARDSDASAMAMPFTAPIWSRGAAWPPRRAGQCRVGRRGVCDGRPASCGTACHV